MNAEKPLILIIEDVKIKIAKTLNESINQGIPAFLLESILCESLAEIRKIKGNELVTACQRQEEQAKKENEEQE